MSSKCYRCEQLLEFGLVFLIRPALRIKNLYRNEYKTDSDYNECSNCCIDAL